MPRVRTAQQVSARIDAHLERVERRRRRRGLPSPQVLVRADGLVLR